MPYTFANLDIDHATTPESRALLAAKLTQDLADAVGRLWRAYDENDELNTEQPDLAPEVYAASLDEWTHGLWALRDHWKEKAGMIAGADWGPDAWAGRDAMVRGLACAFVDALAEDIGEENFAEVRARNAKPPYLDAPGLIGPCASHDFCDANMTMLRAFEGLMKREPAYFEGTDKAGNWSPKAEADLDIWNDAWSLAKREFLTA